MNSWTRYAMVAGVVAGMACGAAQAQVVCKATTPESKMNEAWWKTRHEQKLDLVKKGGWEVVFVGDSITQGFEGSAAWKKYYEARKALGLGFSGDRTENVLWRLDNGEIEGLAPKLVIIMIGTNNAGHRKDPAEQTAEGIKLIVERLRAKMPNAKILVLGIFPRGPNSQDACRLLNDKTNEIIAELDDGKSVFFLNINGKLQAEDGTLSKEVMPDLLHPNAKGQEIWAESMEPMVAKLLK